MPRVGVSIAKETEPCPEVRSCMGLPGGRPLLRWPSTFPGQPSTTQSWPRWPRSSIHAWVPAEPRPSAIIFHFKKLKKRQTCSTYKGTSHNIIDPHERHQREEVSAVHRAGFQFLGGDKREPAARAHAILSLHRQAPLAVRVSAWHSAVLPCAFGAAHGVALHRRSGYVLFQLTLVSRSGRLIHAGRSSLPL